MPHCLLQTETLQLIVDPSLGGAIRRLDLRGPSGAWTPLLRPTPEHARSREEAGSFFMLPWVGRIPEGRFTFEGREHQLRRDSTDGLHAIHGDVSQRPWTITDRSPVSVRMELDGARLADRNWPWTYLADARYELGPGLVRCELGITNTSRDRFPIGAGFHPYFQRRLWAEGPEDSCLLHAPAAGHYPLTNLAATGPANFDHWCQELSAGTTLPRPTDDAFILAPGLMEVRWPRSGVRVVLETDHAMKHLVCWAPHEGGRPSSFFCVEPLSSTTNAFNLHNDGQPDTGVRVLSHGERASFTMNLRIGTL